MAILRAVLRSFQEKSYTAYMNTLWIEEVRGLTKTFHFVDFSAALIFTNKVGAVAEKYNHHPDIALRNYNTVTITTSTHDSDNTVTQKDWELSRAIDDLQKSKSNKKFLTPIRIIEFIIAGLIIDLVENIITLRLTGEIITWRVVGIAFLVVVPFAILTELIIDHPDFWKRLFRNKTK